MADIKAMVTKEDIVSDNKANSEVIGKSSLDKPQYKSDEIDKILADIIEYPYTTLALEKKIHAAGINLENKERRIKEIRQQIFLEVSSEKLDGKNKYSNEAMRDAETESRLKESPEAKNLLFELDRVSKEMGLAKIDLDFEKKKFKVAELIAEFTKIKFRIY